MKENLRYIVIGNDEKAICTYGIGWSITEIIEAHPEAKAICLADKTRPDRIISTVVVPDLASLLIGRVPAKNKARVQVVMDATGCGEQEAISYLDAEEWDCIDAVRTLRGDKPTRPQA